MRPARASVVLVLALAAPVQAQPTVPPHYRAAIFRTADLAGPTSLAFDARGRLFVAQIDGRILILEDNDHDGVADPAAKVFASGLVHLHGIVFLGNVLYATNFDKIITLEDRDGDDVAETETDLVVGLPVGAAPNIHSANGIAIGKDGKVYFSLGSTCDRCQEADPRSATVMRINPDGSGFEIFASGLRNTYDIAFNAAGDLLAGDNQFNYGSTDDYPPDELNHVRQGLNYGWPDYEGFPPPGTGTTDPICTMPPHCSPDGLHIYRALQFPGCQDDGFICLWGEVQGPVSGHVVQRLHLAADGNGSYTAAPVNFAATMIHPIDATANRIGDLFIADYGFMGDPPTASAIFRIWFVDLEITGDPGIGNTITFAMSGEGGNPFVLFGSLGTSYIPLGGWGAFRLDPSSLYVVTTGTIPSGGELLISAPIPDDPSLIGITFHHQMARAIGWKAYLGVEAPLTIGP
ncbi:MAG: PQQ-dependent sugar dehydrogenase [Planctomycetota bacterium]